MNEKTIRCICGKLYVVHDMHCRNQTYCPDCRLKKNEELEKNIVKDWKIVSSKIRKPSKYSKRV